MFHCKVGIETQNGIESIITLSVPLLSQHSHLVVIYCNYNNNAVALVNGVRSVLFCSLCVC